MATSYANSGGTGNRTATITVTTAGTGGSGTPANLVDGALTANSTNSISLGTGGWVAGAKLLFDFGTAAKIIDEAKWYQSTTDTHGTWKWRGTIDGVNFTDIGASFSLGGTSGTQTLTTLNGNVTAFRKYALEYVSGTVSNAPWIEEVEFKIDVGAAAFRLTASVGAFAITGVTIIMRRALHLIIAQGAFVVTGNAAILRYGRRITAAAGSFIITGHHATMLVRRITPSKLFRKAVFVLQKLRTTDPTLKD